MKINNETVKIEKAVAAKASAMRLRAETAGQLVLDEF